MSLLKVSVTDARGRPIAGRGLEFWLPRAVPAFARGAVTIALVSDRTMRALNQRYRGVDRPTDVLSFPAVLERRGRGPRSLGDIAIALGVAQRQAREQDHDLRTELRILALHGMLHLLGYDHEADQGQMQRLEERLRRRSGLPASLIVRSGAPGRIDRGGRTPARSHRRSGRAPSAKARP